METKQFLDLVGLVEYDSLIKAFIEGKIFIGTYEEYNTANTNGLIQLGAIVCILDDNQTEGGSSGGSGDSSDTTSPTNAVLGYAVLGQMVLG